MSDRDMLDYFNGLGCIAAILMKRNKSYNEPLMMAERSDIMQFATDI